MSESETNMENVRGLDRGNPAMEEPAKQFQYPGDRTGRITETPTRLEDGDLIEAVSRAILRELEGGASSNGIGITMGFFPPRPVF